MLGIAAAFRRLNRWRVHCGATYEWGARAISPYFGFLTGWVIFLAYFLGVVSVVLPIGPYVVSLFGNANSRLSEAVIGFIATIFVTVVAYIGIKIAAWVQWLLIAIEYVGVTILAILCLIAVFGHHPGTVAFSISWFSWKTMGGVSGLIAASLTAVYMFSGWDTGIMVNEETENARESPGNAVVLSVIVLALMFAFFTFAFQGAVGKSQLAAHSNALSYIAQVVSGSLLAKYMIVCVTLSALGSTMATLVSGAREAFAMGSDGVLPRVFARTHPRFKSPTVATLVVAVLAGAGVWVYTLGSSTVQSSFDTIVSVDGLLFGLFYALTGIATVVYYRKVAASGVWNFVNLILFPLASAVFLLYVIYRSVGGLGGWGSGSMISLYVLIGIGVAIMAYGKLAGSSEYFNTPREAFELDPAGSGGTHRPAA